MLRGFRDRWDIPLKNLQKTLDHGVLLMEKTISYLDDVQRLTTKVSHLVDRVECLVAQEEELNKLEREKIQLEIEILKQERNNRSSKVEKKIRSKGGKGH